MIKYEIFRRAYSVKIYLSGLRLLFVVLFITHLISISDATAETSIVRGGTCKFKNLQAFGEDFELAFLTEDQKHTCYTIKRVLGRYFPTASRGPLVVRLLLEPADVLSIPEASKGFTRLNKLILRSNKRLSKARLDFFRTMIEQFPISNLDLSSQAVAILQRFSTVSSSKRTVERFLQKNKLRRLLSKAVSEVEAQLVVGYHIDGLLIALPGLDKASLELKSTPYIGPTRRKVTIENFVLINKKGLGEEPSPLDPANPDNPDALENTPDLVSNRIANEAVDAAGRSF